MTRKLLVVTVENCRDCPNFYATMRELRCRKAKRRIGRRLLGHPEIEIAPWCPLPDAPTVDSTDTKEAGR